MRLGDGPVYLDTDGHGDTMGHRHAGGNLDCLLSLHWHLPALTVNLLLARPGWGGDKRDSESRVEAKRRRGDNRNAWKEELRVSFSIGLGLSLALSDPCSIKVGGNNNRDSSEDWLGGDLGLELGADLGDNVLALGGEACLGHSLGLIGALLGLSALLLCGAHLLSDGLGHIFTPGLSGALLLIFADLLHHSLTHHLRHLLHNVDALLLSRVGALLLGNIPDHSDALLLGVGAALLPRLSPDLGHGNVGAHTLSDVGADLRTCSV